MSKGWSYVSGEWWISCDVCQTQVRASEAKHRWDGLITCPKDFEERHPQDFVRVKPESYTLPFTRPEPADVFSVACDMVTSSAYAGLGTAGCMRAGNATDEYQVFLDNYACSIDEKRGLAGFAVAGCARPSYGTMGYI